MKKKKNLLFINPFIYDFACYDFWLKPLGLLYLARFLQNRGYKIHFIDCLDIINPEMIRDASIKEPKRREYGCGRFYKQNIDKPKHLKNIPRKYSRYGITLEVFKKELSKIPHPDAILVTSMMTYWYPGPFKAIEICKSIFKGVPIILGGIYATLCYDHAKRNSMADYIVRGGNIKEIVNLVDNLTDYKGIEKEPEKKLLSGYPLFDLLRRIDYVCLLTSIGCPYRCDYCASSFLNPHFSFRDPIETVDEIEYWYKKRGVRDFAFYDDALLFNPEEHLLTMLKEILRRNMVCNLHAPNGLLMRGVTSDVASLMYRAGFKTIRWGFETSNVKGQLLNASKVTNEEFHASVCYLKEAGFPSHDIGIYILAGLPYQTKEEIEETIDFVFKAGTRPIITEYSPIPETRLWEDAVRFSKFPVAEEPLFHNNSIVPCQWEGLTYNDLDLLKLKIKNLPC